MFRRVVFVALVMVASMLAACTASTYWSQWDAPLETAQDAPPQLATHKVVAGETAYSIARLYKIPVADLARANGLGEGFMIRAGQTLAIPGAAAERAPGRFGVPEPAAKPLLRVARSAPARGAGLIWPVTGPVISPYGAKEDGRFNEGVNIAAPEGTPVWAAGDGVVSYAGNEIRGYGNLVLIRHKDGLVTAYAHNKRIAVRKGARVHQGQVIAVSGATGSVGDPQLHFEVRRNGVPVDPVAMLGAASDVAAR